MKFNRLFLVILILPLFARGGCEGDQGPAGPAGADGADGTNGTDGADGVDGNVTCLDCHNTETQNAISFQFDRSQHDAGTIAVDYAGGRASCARCHSGNGFVEWAETGTIESDITTPQPWACNTCHSIHTSFEVTDYAFRIDPANPVESVFDETYTFDFGDNSNLCANCHQSRRAEPNIDVPGETFAITSTHYGPHHGAQSNVYDGSGFAEIAGSTAYPATNLHVTAGATCVTCHMAEYADGTGGHTWWPSENACDDCHGGGFAYGGVQAEVEDDLMTLRDQLVALGVVEYVEADDAYEPVVGTYPMAHAQAFFNWIGLEEDRSFGVHNPRYVAALIANSIEATAPAN
jgi:formate-dependent nitrite reductase cytochrome c552 subunit